MQYHLVEDGCVERHKEDKLKMLLLDCTLRDGGYVNDWNFGYDNIINIYERLVSAKIDIIEVGFLDERRPLDVNYSIYPDTSGVDKAFGKLRKGKSLIVGMIDYGTCSIEKIGEGSNSFLDGIRVIFKKEKMYQATEFCRQVKEKGYKVFVQAVSITSYDDGIFQELLTLVNGLNPYAFSLVDTYGLLHREDLQKYLQMADDGLKPEIALGYHAHNNFQLAYSNCIEFLEQSVEREVLVDGTLYGMGKSAGNAPMELLSMYMNNRCGKAYNVNQLLEAIDVNILDIYRKWPWGYAFKFYLSALHDCHPNYVMFLQSKQKLSAKSISQILDSIPEEKKLSFDAEYIEQLYLRYQAKECNDLADKEKLRQLLRGDRKEKPILLLGPGNNIYTQKKRVELCMGALDPIVIAVNFLPDRYAIDALFISNAKRYVQLSAKLIQYQNRPAVIATSNITSTGREFEYILNYSALLDEAAWIVDNPLIMILRLLKQFGLKEVYLAGFDGYSKVETVNYINENMEYAFTREKALQLNKDVVDSLNRFRLADMVHFVTDTLYQL